MHRAETKQNNHTACAPRIAAIDTGRGLAILMIVTAHVLRKGAAADYLMSTGVVLFCVLSGYVMHRKGTFLQSVQKRLKRIYLPYLAVGLVSILVYSVLGRYAGSLLQTNAKETETGILQNLWYLLYANSKNHHSMKWNETLWFFPCFLAALLLSALIEALVQAAAGKNAEAKKQETRDREGESTQRAGKQERAGDGILQERKQNILRLVLSLLVLLAGWILVSLYDARLPWQGETACHMLPFLELGIALGERDRRRREKKRESESCGCTAAALTGNDRSGGGENPDRKERTGSLLQTVLLLAAGILLSIPFGGSSIRTDEYPAGFLSYLTIALNVLAFWEIAKILPAWETLEKLGRRSLGVMLWNKFPVVAVQAAAKHAGIAKWFLEKSTPAAVLIAFLLAIVCVGLCLVWTGIPAWGKAVCRGTAGTAGDGRA